MSVVVADASPLNYLIQIGSADVLAALFGKVIVPSAVVDELSHVRAPEGVRAWVRRLPAWLVVKTPERVSEFGAVLGRGETHAIALACEMNDSLVLLDDRAARRIATEKNLKVLGTIGVLERADEKNLLDLRRALQKLVQTNFRIDARTIEDALARSAERRRK